MPQLPPSVQISLLLLVAFLIGIAMTWFYWRRKQQKALDHALFDRDREIEKLKSEIDQLEIEGVKVSPSEYVRSKKSVIFRRDEKIAQLERELEHLQMDGEKVSASYFVIKTQKELKKRELEIAELKNKLERPPEVATEGTGEGQEAAELQQLRAMLKTFVVEGKEVSPQEYIRLKREEIDGLKQEIETYQSRLKEKEVAVEANGEDFSENNIRLIYNGIEMDMEEYQATLKNELENRDQHIQRLQNEIDLLRMNKEDGKFLSPGEAFSQLKQKLAEKDAEIERLSSGFNLVLDKDDFDNEDALSPIEAFRALKQKLSQKEEQISSLKEDIRLQQEELESMKPVAITPGEAFAAMQGRQTETKNGQDESQEKLALELKTLKEEVEAKNQELESLRQRFAFLPSEELEPEFQFNELKAQIQEKEDEIAHFKEELEQLGIETPNTVTRIGLPEALRLLKIHLLEKEAENEALKARIEEGATSSEKAPASSEFAAEVMRQELEAKLHAREAELEELKAQQLELPSPTTDDDELEALKAKLAKKEEELAKFVAAFDFIPKPENPEVEAPEPRFVFEQLKQEIEEKDREIAHFNEELAGLSIETPETEHRLGLPEALRLIQVRLHEKDEVIEQLQQEIEALKTAGVEELSQANGISVPEEVSSEAVLADSDEDWSAITREYTIENLSTSPAPNPNMEVEAELLKEGFAELGREFTRSMKEFLPASVYEKLQGLDDEGISISDHSGYFLVFNERLQEMIGYSRAEANDEREQSFLERLYPDPNYRAIVGRNIASIPVDGTFDTNTAYITAKDGSIKHLEVSSTSFYYAGQKYYLSYYTPAE